MRTTLAALVLLSLCRAGAAGEISSEYTDLEAEKDCAVFSAAGEGAA